MSTEKNIVLQAKNNLKGNWVTLIMAGIFILATIYTIISAGYLVCTISNLLDFENEDIIENAGLPYILIIVCIAICGLSVSPLINGFFKMAYTIAKGYKITFADLFFYFNKTSHYFNTLLLNFIYAIIMGAVIFAFNFNWILNLITNNIENDTLSFIAKIFAGSALNVLSIILIGFFYILFVNSSMFLYAENPNLNALKCFGIGVKISFKNFISYIKLFFGFSGWIALCFFVVPALYVFPYIAVSFATSSKWLISMERGRISV